MKRLCSICARGGSQGVPGKNVRPLAGLPLIAHSIRQARATGLFDRIAVSSDNAEILSVAAAHGADILVDRPAEMATNRAPKLPAIQHCAREAEARSGLDFDIFCDLDATSPLRAPEDIAGAVALMEGGGCDNVITGAPAHRSPYFNMLERSPDGFVRLVKPPPVDVVRRQDAPPCFDCNASVYVWDRDTIFVATEVVTERTRLYEMPAERSLDIDTELDFDIVTFLMQRTAKA